MELFLTYGEIRSSVGMAVSWKLNRDRVIPALRAGPFVYECA